MKPLLISLSVLFCCTLCFAQRTTRRTVEVEVGLGVLQSFDNVIFDQTLPGAVPYAEIKYVFKTIPLDLGLNASVQIFERRSSVDRMNYISKNIMAVADYSFYETSSTRAYVGIGAGMGFFDYDQWVYRVSPSSFSSTDSKYAPLCVMPRVGICFFKHLNLSIGYLFEDKANRNLNFRVGFVF